MKTSYNSKRIDGGITTLVLDQPFFATLAMRLQVSQSDQVPTFATDGKRMLVNPSYLDTLSEGKVVTVIAHEVLHCALGHLWRIPMGTDAKRWNTAIDYEANAVLMDFNKQAQAAGRAIPFEPVPGWLYDPAFDNTAAEIILRKLPEPPPAGGNKRNGQPNGKQKGQSSSTPSKQHQQPDDQPSPGEVLPVPQNEQAAMKEEWEKAVIQAVMAAKGRGTIPGAIEKLVETLTDTKLDYKQLLRDYLRDIAEADYSWSRANRRYAGTDFLLPTLRDEGSGHVVWAVDTSGSTSAFWDGFITEAQWCLDTLRPSKLTVLQCDTRITSRQEFEPGDNIVQAVTIRGGGGTDFRPIFEALENECETPSVLVFLTDMDGTMPDHAPQYPVLWIKTNQTAAPFGDSIQL